MSYKDAEICNDLEESYYYNYTKFIFSMFSFRSQLGIFTYLPNNTVKSYNK